MILLRPLPNDAFYAFSHLSHFLLKNDLVISSSARRAGPDGLGQRTAQGSQKGGPYGGGVLRRRPVVTGAGLILDEVVVTSFGLRSRHFPVRASGTQSEARVVTTCSRAATRS